jgi:predicted DNA-binding transcriptional regulator YafY
LFVYCLTRCDTRLFKLLRIKDLHITGERFKERVLPTAQPDAGALAKKYRIVTIKLRVEPEMAFRVYDEFFDDKIEKQPDGGYIVTVTWPEDEWVYGTILSYGEYIEVLEPKRIRDIIGDKSRKTAEKYAD